MQSRRWSLAEAIVNMLGNLVLGVAVQEVIYPLYGFRSTHGQNVSIAAIFMGVSLVRSYIIRRLFSRLGRSRGEG